jgi:CheY-like chemotaxis protein
MTLSDVRPAQRRSRRRSATVAAVRATPATAALEPALELLGAYGQSVSVVVAVFGLDRRLGDGEHGWRILDHLTLDPATRRIPVILWSGAHESLHAHAPALLPQHGIFVLPKPFDLGTLLATIDQALAAHPPVVRLNARQPAAGGAARRGPGRLSPREQEVARLIGAMLGVRRPSVTVAAGLLQQAALIR